RQSLEWEFKSIISMKFEMDTHILYNAIIPALGECKRSMQVAQEYDNPCLLM
ncbi:hypothetical protein NF27_GA00020, partial [Candidatus Jidaibacter acanthamoeba]